MRIGVPRETYLHENRVGLTPTSVAKLSRHGHDVVVEAGAGIGAHFTDHDFENAGAQIVYQPDEAYLRSDLVCRVSSLAKDELERLGAGSVICGFHHLAVTPREQVDRLRDLGVSLVGYELVRDRHGTRPILLAMSELAGHFVVNLAAHYLQTEAGGRGILLGNVPGVPPPTVLILGAGTVGRTAARQALNSGAHVIVVDIDVARLRAVNQELQGAAVTVVADRNRIERFSAFADVVIGAVLVPGGKTPVLVSERMVQAMKPGTVIIDLSIDQGGCVETSRPTTLETPTFVTHEVIHYCVPNMTANLARTASRVLSNAALPLILELAESGLDTALSRSPGLAAGLYLYRGRMVNEATAGSLGLPCETLESLLPEGSQE